MLNPTAFVNIQAWMVTELNLSGNELFCYAIIHNFCMDGVSSFYGGYRYLGEWLNVDNSTVIRVMNRLIKKGLIEKRQEVKNGVITNYFKAVLPNENPQTETPQDTPKPETVEAEKVNDEDRTLEIQFNTFWEAYPKQRKAGKDKPRKKFFQIIKSKKATAQQIIDATKAYADSEEVLRGFAKEPYSWLLNERYLVDYSVKIKPTLSFKEMKELQNEIELEKIRQGVA